MQAVEALEVLAGWDPSVHTYEDVLRAERLSVGLSLWPAGQPDTQSPHGEDEVYYVIEGRGRITVAGEARPVSAGSIVYVPAGVEHRFHDIEQDLRVLVFWAPPYSGRRG